jgi:hypothetical protein
MSDKNLEQPEIPRDPTCGLLAASIAAKLLGLERRQFQGLAKARRDKGATNLFSNERGQPSNRHTQATLKVEALAVILTLRPAPISSSIEEVTSITNRRPEPSNRMELVWLYL